MKKIILTTLLLLPMYTFAAPVSWDGNFGTQILQPLQSLWSAVVKASSFTSTSTTVASIFPYATTTYISASTASTSALVASNSATFSFLGTGLAKITSGVLGLATAGVDYQTPLSAGTDYEVPLTFGDALTRTANDIDFDGGATPAGDLGGTWASPSVTDDSHAHTGATLSGIDISGDTNLTAGDGLTLTDDDLDCDTASGSVFGCLASADWTTFNNKLGSYDAWTHSGAGKSATTSDIGIGTTSPGTALGVTGDAVIAGEVTARIFTATSTATASTFPYASTTALTVSGSSHLGSLIQKGATLGLSTDTDLLTFASNDLLLSSSNADWDHLRLVSSDIQTGVGFYTSGDDWQLYNNNGTFTFREATGAKTPLTINPTSGLSTLLYSSTTAASITGSGASFVVSSASANIGLATSTQPSTKVELGGTQLTSGGDNGTGEFLNLSGLLNFSSSADQGSLIKLQPTITNSGSSNIFYGINVDPRSITNTNQISNYISYRAAEETNNTFGTTSIGFLYGNPPGGTTDYAIYTNSADASHFGGGIQMANNTFVSWLNTGGSLRTIMSLNSANDVIIKTADSLALRFFNSQGNRELARLNQTEYASFGVGTTSPWGALTASSSSATAPALTIAQHSTGDILRAYDATNLSFVIKDGGNTGIGTTTPGNLLSVQKNANDATPLAVFATSTASTASPNASSTQFWIDFDGIAKIRDIFDNKAKYTSGAGMWQTAATSSTWSISKENEADQVLVSYPFRFTEARTNPWVEIDGSIDNSGVCPGGDDPTLKVVLSTSPTGQSNVNGVAVQERLGAWEGGAFGSCQAEDTNSSGTLYCEFGVGRAGLSFTYGATAYLNVVAADFNDTDCVVGLTGFRVYFH